MNDILDPKRVFRYACDTPGCTGGYPLSQKDGAPPPQETQRFFCPRCKDIVPMTLAEPKSGQLVGYLKG